MKISLENPSLDEAANWVCRKIFAESPNTLSQLVWNFLSY